MANISLSGSILKVKAEVKPSRQRSCPRHLPAPQSSAPLQTGSVASAKGRLIEKLVQRQRVSLSEFNVMPFGLCNSPSTSQRHMDLILAAVQWATCSADLDDVIVFGRTFQEH